MNGRPLSQRLEHVQQLLYVLGEDACARDVAEAVRMAAEQEQRTAGEPRVYVRVLDDGISTTDGG